MIKKHFGQNFISDKNLISKIISILDNKNDSIVEIGPGRGALTQFLVNNYKEVIAIEIDTDLESYLSKYRENGLKIIYRDFMDVKIEEIIDPKKNISFISNTPYYLTSQIIFKIFKLSEKLNINKAVLMTQKEVAERITAKVGNSKYNNLSIACEMFAKCKVEFNVSKKMFFPVPKIDSSIVSFDFSINKQTKFNKFKIIEMVRKLFNNKRKTILNNIKNLGLDINPIDVLEKLNIQPNLRPSDISTDKFIEIYKELYGGQND